MGVDAHPRGDPRRHHRPRPGPTDRRSGDRGSRRLTDGNWQAIGAEAVAFGLAAALVPVVRRIALRRGYTDRPNGERWSRTATPYLGGAALALAVLGGVLVAEPWERDVLLLLGAAVVLAVLGLVDDIRTVSPQVKLAAEAAAGVAAFSAGCRFDLGPAPVDLALTVAVVVVVTNGFNLLDNIDGALAAVGAVVGGGIGAAALLAHQPLLGSVALAAAGATVGFLVHNWHPASIFLGDCGSLFLGFLLAASSLGLDTTGSPAAAAVAVVLFLAPALFDVTLVVIHRVGEGRSIFIGGTDHTSHRLVRRGLGTRAAVLAITAGAALTTALGVGVARGTLPPAPVAAVALAASAGLLAVLLRTPGPDPGVEVATGS